MMCDMSGKTKLGVFEWVKQGEIGEFRGNWKLEKEFGKLEKVFRTIIGTFEMFFLEKKIFRSLSFGIFVKS